MEQEQVPDGTDSGENGVAVLRQIRDLLTSIDTKLNDITGVAGQRPDEVRGD